MLSIPLDFDSRQAEIATIKKIAAVNKIDLDVDQMIRRMSARSLLAENRLSPPDAISSSRKPRWMKLPYLGPASDKLASLLKRYNYRVGFYPLSTISQLVRLKDHSSKFDKSGIYQLTCGQCQAVYIGQTGRKLGTRLAEHRAALKPASTKKSAFADHCRACQHDFFKREVSLLHTCPKGRIMDKLEETETIVAATSLDKLLLNNLTATYVTPFIRYVFSYTPSFAGDE